MTHMEYALENYLIVPALKWLNFRKEKTSKKTSIAISKGAPDQKYTIYNTDVTKWIETNHAKLASKYNGSNNEWLVSNNGNDPKIVEFLLYMAQLLKEEAWKYKEPIMIFSAKNKAKDPAGSIAVYTKTFEHMASEGIVSAGYVTIKFLEGSLEGMLQNHDKNIKTELWYHEVWNVDTPNDCKSGKEFPIISISWKLP